MRTIRLPRILITAPSSGTGKTLITCGLLQAMANREKKVCAFKCGPDYIDPMFHRQVLEIPSYNLDTFLASDDETRRVMADHGEGMDIAIIEGVMGYYDGLGGVSDEASTYHVGRTTGTPAILVMNFKGQSLSGAAVVKGMAGFRKDSRIKGVILNRTKESMYKVMSEAIEAETGVPVLGYVPEDASLGLESRHLGLVMPGEIRDLREKIDGFSHTLEETVDIDRLIEIAEGAEDIEICCESNDRKTTGRSRTWDGLKIAVARDEAFCFIYEDNIQLLGNMGADIAWFSPIHDEKLPDDADGIILYGGYPELHGKELSGNISMRASVADAIRRGIPCMAECGGFIYLHDEFEDAEGVLCKGAGIIEGRAFRTERLTRFGYIDIESKKDGLLRADDASRTVHAHEFHYYDSTSNGSSCIARKPKGRRSWQCIHEEGNLLAGFPHMYYRGCPHVAENFLARCWVGRRDGEKDEI